jgi:outer membrane protein assembly factor BamB
MRCSIVGRRRIAAVTLGLFGLAFMTAADEPVRVAQRTKTPRDTVKAEANDLALAEALHGNWSRWRGPNNDGVSLEKSLLDSWPADGPPLEWKASGLGGGYSSVSVVDGKIYSMGSKGGTTITCRSTKDGSEIWTTKIGGGGDPNCTPTVDGDLVFGVSKDGDLACCRTSDGELVWSKNFGRDFGGKMHSGWGYSESPLVDGELLICTPGANDAMLAALNKNTGEVVWKTKMPADTGKKGGDGAAYASPVVAHCAGVKQYITLVGRGVISADAKTGELLWGYNRVANGTANIPTPIVKGDFVFCSSGYGDGGTALLKISKKGKALSAEEVYWYDANKLQNHHGGMILLGDYVYMGHGHNEGFPVCVDFKTGKPTWGPDRGVGSGSAAVAYADGHLYFRYQSGMMVLIEANPKAYKVTGKFKIATKNGESWPHPVIAGGKLYLRDQNDLLCYDIRK